MNTMQKYSHTQVGITMLEVLVAIVVLSFGLLGMLGLIMNSLKMTSSSHYRTIAAQQLAAMAEAISANPNLITNYAPPGGTPNYANCLGTAGCSTADLPQTDYALWQLNIAAPAQSPPDPRVGLPGARGVVCLDSTPNDGNSANFLCDGTGRPTIKICWNENARIATSKGGVLGNDSSTDTCLSVQI